MWEASMVVLWLRASSTARLSGSCSAASGPQKENRNAPRIRTRDAGAEAGCMVPPKRLLGKAIVNEGAQFSDVLTTQRAQSGQRELFRQARVSNDQPPTDLVFAGHCREFRRGAFLNR